MGRGYSGNHPRFSHRQDERYDAKEAYNKDLTASARLHYLENDRHDHESPANSHCSPMHRHNDRHIMREAKKIARQNEGDVQDIYYELKSKVANDERAQAKEAAKEGLNVLSAKKFVNDERSGEIRNQMIDEMIDERPDSPMNACAKSEGGKGCIQQMGGAWRVISNKTDKPWPAKYASKSKAEAALRGYHAG